MDGQRNTDPPRTATIFTDNQAAIQACAHPRRSSGQQSVREISCLVEALRGIGCYVRIRLDTGARGCSGQQMSGQVGQ
jgi:hypothetical protein